ncbi:MAG: Abi-alpha family protein [Pseudodesulfovibrio sp.]|uniref:Abi-alpha family protein n=1 Tax=Pseudodesulfovibrio sp. TaxID=2035812 RepID=UPI003D0C6BE8
MPDDFTDKIATAFGKEAAKELLGFWGDITRIPAKELGEMFADQIKFYRLKNLLRITQKARTICQEHDIQADQIPIRFAVPFLEHASLEDNEYLQKKWANLLAASLIPGTPSNIRLYVDFLKTISPIEARILDYLYNGSITIAVGGKGKRPTSAPATHDAKDIKEYLGIDTTALVLSCDNLERLQLIKIYNNVPLSYIGKNGHLATAMMPKDAYSNITLTWLGVNFLEHCSGTPNQSSYSVGDF